MLYMDRFDHCWHYKGRHTHPPPPIIGAEQNPLCTIRAAPPSPYRPPHSTSLLYNPPIPQIPKPNPPPLLKKNTHKHQKRTKQNKKENPTPLYAPPPNFGLFKPRGRAVGGGALTSRALSVVLKEMAAP